MYKRYINSIIIIIIIKTKRWLSKWDAGTSEELPADKSEASCWVSYREGIIKLADRDSPQRVGLQSE